MRLIATALRRSARDRTNEGFTMVELIVVTFVMSLVLTVLYSTLVSFTRTTASVANKSVSVTDVRLAMETLSRDIRAANPIDAQASPSLYNNNVQFKVFCSAAGVGTCSTTNLRPVAYTVSANSLRQGTRTLLGPRGTPSLPAGQRAGAIVNNCPATGACPEPPFTYLTSEGVALDTGPGGDSPTRFKDCARTVVIRLKVVADPGDLTHLIDIKSQVNLRNYKEGSGLC